MYKNGKGGKGDKGGKGGGGGSGGDSVDLTAVESLVSACINARQIKVDVSTIANY